MDVARPDHTVVRNSSGYCVCSALSPDGHHFFAGYNSTTIECIALQRDKEGGKLSKTRRVRRYSTKSTRNPRFLPKCLAVSPDNKYLVVGCNRSSIVVFDIASKKRVNWVDKFGMCVPVTAISFTTDGLSMMVCAGRDAYAGSVCHT
jgi:WD40 repeat protein